MVRFRYDLLSRPCPKVRSLQGCFQPASNDTVARTISGLSYGSNKTILPMELSSTGVLVSIAASQHTRILTAYRVPGLVTGFGILFFTVVSA
jgi:hypothetical protein